jgi:hypothetical protein
MDDNFGESAIRDAGITPIRTCFAFNPNYQRCDMPAGHPGDHSITVLWTDDDCWDPSTAAPPILTAAPLPAAALGGAPLSFDGETPIRYTEDGTPVFEMEYVPGIETEDNPNDVCVACAHPRHRHVEGGCNVMDSEGERCGCHTCI